MTHAERSAPSAAAIVSLVGLVGAMALLHHLGRGSLAAPPLGSMAAAAAWATDRDPAVLAMVLVRLVSLAVGYHLLLTTVLVAIGRALRAPRLVDVAGAMTLPLFRSTAGRLAGLAISASAVVGGALPSADAAPAPVEHLAQPGPTAPGAGPAFIERVALPPGPTATSDATTATIRAIAPASAPAAAPAPTLHRVRPGDHLWGIAEGALGTALGRAPTDAEVDPFWRQVILANPDIVDPDLIFPGQVVVVPPVSRPAG